MFTQFQATMLTDQRKSLLLDRLRAEGRLVATDLAAELGCSEDTIRRDLRDLASQGLLLRVHGGALPASPTHRPLADRRSLQTEAKDRLAARAAPLITPGMTVILDGGTTHLALIRHLPLTLAATVITHSPAIAAALEFHDKIEVIVIGGRLFRHSMVATGAASHAAFARVQADLCLLGVTGLSPERGLTTGDDEEAQIKRRMMDSAAETLVLATPDKIGAASPWAIAPLAELATLITTGPAPAWLPGSLAHLSA
jgi:DeoR/GlpR family transcriptional regulator of sugar metabolism